MAVNRVWLLPAPVAEVENPLQMSILLGYPFDINADAEFEEYIRRYLNDPAD